MTTTTETDERLDKATSAILRILAELVGAGLAKRDASGVVTFAVAAPEALSGAHPEIGECMCTPMLFVELRQPPTHPTKATMAAEVDTFTTGTPRASAVQLLALARQRGEFGGDE